MPSGFAQTGQYLGGVLAQMGQGRLAGKAMQGDPRALQQLASLNPDAAQQITDRFQKQQVEQEGLDIQRMQQQRMVEKERRMQRQDDIKRDDRLRKLSIENLEVANNVMEDLKGSRNYEDYKARTEKLKTNPVLQRILGNDIGALLDSSPDAYRQFQEQMKQQAFAGKEMKAQYNNMLIQGATNPSFRDTPEYAIAWQNLTKGEVIDTPEGKIIRKPKLDPRFKPPGADALSTPLTSDQITPNPDSPIPGTLKDPQYIPGTRKLSSDQKDYNKDFLIIDNSYKAVDNYRNVLNELGPKMKLGLLISKDAQKLYSAYMRAILVLKELNNLGVINGPDLTILRQFLGDPRGLAGKGARKEALMAGADQVMMQVTDSLGSLNSLFEGSEVKARAFEKEDEDKMNRAKYRGAPMIGFIDENMRYIGGPYWKGSAWKRRGEPDESEESEE